MLNLTPVPRDDYRIGVPDARRATALRLYSDAPEFGGSGYADARGASTTEAVPWHGFAQSIRLRLPPLGALVLAPADADAPRAPALARLAERLGILPALRRHHGHRAPHLRSHARGALLPPSATTARASRGGRGAPRARSTPRRGAR